MKLKQPNEPKQNKSIGIDLKPTIKNGELDIPKSAKKLFIVLLFTTPIAFLVLPINIATNILIGSVVFAFIYAGWIAWEYVEQDSRFGGNSVISIGKANKALHNRLLALLQGDKSAADRLISITRSKYPSKSLDWCTQKCIDDLLKDRGK